MLKLVAFVVFAFAAPTVLAQQADTPKQCHFSKVTTKKNRKLVASTLSYYIADAGTARWLNVSGIPTHAEMDSDDVEACFTAGSKTLSGSSIQQPAQAYFAAWLDLDSQPSEATYQAFRQAQNKFQAAIDSL